MKKLSCKDIGGMDCSFTAIGKTNKEVIDKMFAHAAKVHQDKLASMSNEDKTNMVNLMNNILSKQK